jgi:Leucine-rich repeat (LRR) protein
MKRKTYLSGIFILLTVTINLCAQITIGSGESPLAGCLLDLKQQDPVTPSGATSTKGLNLPRVRLTDLNDITKNISGITAADTARLIGLMVYSVGICDGVGEGVYVWSGSKWEVLFSSTKNAITTNRETDSLALVALYNSTNGAAWTNNTNWLSNQPIDTWYGVTMDFSRDNCGNRRVEQVNMNNNNITGQLPIELGDMASLSILSLTDNQISGSIPTELSNLTNLTKLLLNNNLMTGPIPAKLGSLSKLTIINLGSNDLTGSIPPELGSLSNLESLALGGNNLTGTIPPELGNLSKITSISAYANGLTGAIPSSLVKLKYLTELNLGNNKLSGSIPSNFGMMTSLTNLHLDNNQLTGDIPPDLGNLTNLINLHLHKNLLTGEIPPELGKLTNLTQLGLNSNLLTGTVPSELGNLTKLQVGAAPNFYGIAKNQLSGPLPQIFKDLATQNSQTVCPQLQSDGTTVVSDPWSNFTCP